MHENPPARLAADQLHNVGANRNFGRRQEDAEQQQIEALRRELTVTRALLQLTELRLNAALGMPPQELAQCVEALNGTGSTLQSKAGAA